MKRAFTILILALFCSSSQAKSQNSDDKQIKELGTSLVQAKCIDLTVGYVPKNVYQALKADFSVNNFFLKRFGAYSSFEKGFESNYFSAILGLTTHFHEHFYLWYGIGVFSHSELNSNNGWSSFRKEIGLGINPYKNLIIRIGISQTVGPSISIGYRFPNKKVGTL